jgi:Ca2+-dependent lipid-binding protein
VKIYLLPDKSGSSKRKTAVKAKTLEPIFNETFTYELHAASDISNRSIWLSVWDHDKLGKNEFLGEICIKLSTVEFSSDDEKWYTLQSQQEVVLDDNDDQIEDESAAVDAEETCGLE